MIEYMHARVWVNNFTMFTVVNLIGKVGTMSLLGMVSTMRINIVCFSKKVQVKPTSRECNSSTGFF